MTKQKTRPAVDAGQAEDEMMAARMRDREAHLREEEARIRALIRDMHEASQEARDAAKELNDAMKRWGGSATMYYRRVVSEQRKLLVEAVGEHSTAIRKITEDAARQYQEHIAKVLGAESADELLLALTVSLAQAITPIVEKTAAKAVNVKMFRKIVIEEMANALERSLAGEQDDAERDAERESDRKARDSIARLIETLDPVLTKLGSIDIAGLVITREERPGPAEGP